MSEFFIDKNYNIKVSTESNHTYYMFANRLDNDNVANFENWLCEAGVHSLFISYTDEIYSGVCLNDKLGSIDEFQLFEEPTKCKRKRCSGCTSDLSLKKYLVD